MMILNSTKAKNIYFKYGYFIFYIYLVINYFKYKFFTKKLMSSGWHDDRHTEIMYNLRVVEKDKLEKINNKKIKIIDYKKNNNEDIYPLN